MIEYEQLVHEDCLDPRRWYCGRCPCLLQSFFSVDTWSSNTVSSLKDIIEEYNLDGIDINYKHFSSDPHTFSKCIGQLRTVREWYFYKGRKGKTINVYKSFI